MNKIFNFINCLDFLNIFGYVPTFKIKTKDCYKSEIGAAFFLVYSVLFWYYLIYVLIDFIKNQSEVDKIKIFTKKVDHII